MNEAYDIARSIRALFSNSSLMPFDTGNLIAHGIKAVEIAPNTAAVVFGGKNAPYAKYLEFSDFAGRPFKDENNANMRHPNKHKGFVEKIITQEVLPYLEVRYGGKRV